MLLGSKTEDNIVIQIWLINKYSYNSKLFKLFFETITFTILKYTSKYSLFKK